MNENLDEILSRVSMETFESLAFMIPMVDECGDDSPVQVVDPVVCGVDLSGPFHGSVFVAVSRSMLAELAMNMLGMMDEEDEPDADQQADALKELLNVICGNLLPEIAGTEPVFNVEAPRVLDDGQIPESCEQKPLAARAELSVDTGSALVALFLEEKARELLAVPA